MSKFSIARRGLVAAGAATGLLLSIASPANAIISMSIDPTSGPVGTVINVSGDGCYPGDTLTVTLTPGFTGSPYPGGAAPVATVDGSASINDDSTWTVALTVPASASTGDHTVDAVCGYLGGALHRSLRAQEAEYQYESLLFQVTPSETTTTTLAPTTTTLAPTTTTPPPAARAIQARPTYTG